MERWAAWTAGSAAVCFALFALSERRTAREDRAPAWTFAAGMLLGLLGAKLAYYLCQIDFMIAAGWKESLFSLNPEEMSFFGGAAGVCLGVALAARVKGLGPVAVLNRFAPFGLLMGALVRFGEYFLESTGIGPYLENGALCFFPLAKSYSYGADWTEWYLAVFMLEGICLLIVAAVSGRMKSHRFIRSVFWMCLPQILLENLRMDSFMWIFCVRVEQLACMVAMFVILIIHGVRAEGQPRRFLPAAASLLCAGLFIVCEFAMEGKIFMLRFLNKGACYALMAAGQAVLGTLEIIAFRKRRATEGGKA